MLTFELDNGHYSVTPPEGIVLYAGKEATGAHSAMLDYHACRDSDLEIIQSTGGISLVEGFMPAVLARQFQETATDEFEIESEAEGFACVSGWIPTHKARALAAVMRPAA